MRILVLALALTSGCSSSNDEGATTPAETCAAEYSSAKGYGYETEEPICIAADPSKCPPITPETVAADCAAAGVSCDASRFLTREAAFCVARGNGLAEGKSPWKTAFFFHEQKARPVWVVKNVLEENAADCSERGEEITIDAATGDVLDRGTWINVC